jgi:hypothetical protein
MGAAGDPPAALGTNTAGQHVDILQIYEPDVRADEMQPVLQYAASLFGQSRPSTRGEKLLGSTTSPSTDARQENAETRAAG